MLFLGNTPSTTQALIERLGELAEHVLQGLSADTQLRVFTHESDVLACLTPEQVGIIRSGTVIVVNGNSDAVCLEAGDIIGLSRVFGLSYAQLKVEGEATIELVERDDFMAHVHSDPHRQHRFSNYLLTSLSLYQDILAQYHRQDSVSAPTGFEHVSAGEVMIREGEFADTVYQLMSGQADVSVSGVKVGEIHTGEIFGAMAVFTGEQRTATVTASENCQLLAIPKAKFVSLMKAQPEIAITLLNSMSRHVRALNEQVLEIDQNQ